MGQAATGSQAGAGMMASPGQAPVNYPSPTSAVNGSNMAQGQQNNQMSSLSSAIQKIAASLSSAYNHPVVAAAPSPIQIPQGGLAQIQPQNPIQGMQQAPLANVQI